MNAVKNSLAKFNFKNRKMLKILTIVIYALSILIYEIGICNGEVLKKFFSTREFLYNFSMCRIALYIIFFILLFKNIDKFIENTIETLKLKSKKIILCIYIPLMIIVDIYVLIRWISIYKALTLIIALLMGLLFIIYITSNYIKNVIVITFTFGTIFTFSTDFNHAIDEKKHIMSVINIAGGNFNYVKNPLCESAYNNIIFNCDIDSFIQFFAKKYEVNLTDEWNRTEETELYYICSSPADYNFILYIPSTIGVTFAKILGGSIADVYIVGRLFNLIAYSLMVILILKLLPYKQKIFFIIYMLPFQLLLAASFSVDGICLGILGIFIAYCLKLSEINYKEIKLKQILILMALFALCLLVKNLAYCAIILFIFVLPIGKILKNNKKSLPIIFSIIAVAAVICGVLLVNKLTATASFGGDPRGGDTSLIRQVQFLLETPSNIVKVGFEHVMNSLLNYNWYTYLNNVSFFGKYNAQIFFLELIFIVYAVCTDNSKEVSLRTKIVSIITFIGVFASTSLMLYLIFTPVGQINISGYQPRYLTPIFPILFMLVNNKKLVGKMSAQDLEKQDISISLVSGMFIIIDLFCLIYVI